MGQVNKQKAPLPGASLLCGCRGGEMTPRYPLYTQFVTPPHADRGTGTANCSAGRCKSGQADRYIINRDAAHIVALPPIADLCFWIAPPLESCGGAVFVPAHAHALEDRAASVAVEFNVVLRVVVHGVPLFSFLMSVIFGRVKLIRLARSSDTLRRDRRCSRTAPRSSPHPRCPP